MEAIFSKLEGRLSALEIQQRHAFGALNSNQITNDIPQITPKRRESGIPFSSIPKENATNRESFDFSGAAVSMVSKKNSKPSFMKNSLHKISIGSRGKNYGENKRRS